MTTRPTTTTQTLATWSLFDQLQTVEDNITSWHLKEAADAARILHEDSLIRTDTLPEVFLPLTMRLVDLLTLEAIQTCDTVLEPLIRTAALFSAKLYHFFLEPKRHIYPETRARLFINLSKLYLVLPKTQVSMRFALDGSRAAIHLIQPGIGKWRELMKGKAVEAVATLADAAINQAPGTVIAPFLTTILKSWEEKGKDSFISIFEIQKSWYSIRVIKDLGTEKIQDQLSKYDKKAKYAICFADIFSRMIKDKNTDISLKMIVFSAEYFDKDVPRHFNMRERLGFFLNTPQACHLLSLCTLKLPHELKSLRNPSKDPCWKARYLSIEALGELSKIRVGSPIENRMQELSTLFLAYASLTETHEKVKNLILSIYHNSEQKEQWDSYKAEMPRRLVKAKFEAHLSDIESEKQLFLTELEEDKKEKSEKKSMLSNLEDKIIRIKNKYSSQSEGDLDDSEELTENELEMKKLQARIEELDAEKTALVEKIKLCDIEKARISKLEEESIKNLKED
jgi:hypothetical protein